MASYSGELAKSFIASAIAFAVLLFDVCQATCDPIIETPSTVISVTALSMPPEK